MRLILGCSGGVVGSRIQAELDTSDLPADLARRAESCLRPEMLSQAAALASPHRTDVLEYELTLLPQGEGVEFRHYHLSELKTSPEVLELLDDLMREIIEQRSRRR